ncbi:AI-2E family transporter [Tautonia sp. JC769]|uniref:AI-2E family transporter n=1 Tax=Tautonia sp. JC769 TaxID=3232135 RepID=UPI00345991A3
MPTPPTASTAVPPHWGTTVRTISIQLAAAVVIGGAAHLAPGLVVPPLLAIVLAMALSPVARWLEGKGLPPLGSSLICTAGIGAILALIISLLAYEAGELFRQLIGNLDRISTLIAAALRRAGVVTAAATPEFWSVTLSELIRTSLDWTVRRLGGLLGVVAGAIFLLLSLFFLLRRRDAWAGRAFRLADWLGLRRDPEVVKATRNRVASYLGILSVIAASYTVLISLVFWAIGLPNPILWGALTGLLEFIPIFGPLISGSLATLGSLASGTLWKPALVATIFIILHTIEGYILWPIVFGKTIQSDQVTILLGILFFGWLLGPLGPVLGLPLVIILRGLTALTPGTPALDALVAAEDAAD